MISLPLAHIGGLPIDETLGSLGPALLVAFGAASANLRARLRRVRSRASTQPPRKNGGGAQMRAGRSVTHDWPRS
jgi:hypothetical protein